MKVITIANQKGGTGKTTIAVNLAVCALRDGLKVVVVNSDSQPSSFDFAMVRAQKKIEPILPVVNITGDKVHDDIQKYSKVDLIIIDSGGRDSRTFRSSIVAADILVIPVLPSQFDVWATEPTVSIAKKIQEATGNKMSMYILLNQQVHRTLVGDSAKKALDKFGVSRLKTELHFRTSYKKSIIEGKSVIEYTDKEAAREMKALWEEICIWI